MRSRWDTRVARTPRYSEGPNAGKPKPEEEWDEAERAEVEFMRSRSPLHHVVNVRVPMLIAQGANDPRVNRAESDQFVAALRAKGLEVEYVVYEDEGHGFQRPANAIDFVRRAELFLHEVLGGEFEP
jgi:dipeptidyl aminopeptidase/acylaminoacyl peptidase